MAQDETGGTPVLKREAANIEGLWHVDKVGRLCKVIEVKDGVATVAVDNVLGFSQRNVADLRVALAKDLPDFFDKTGYL